MPGTMRWQHLGWRLLPRLQHLGWRLLPRLPVILAVLLVGVAGSQVREPLPGDPLPGIKAEEFERFRLGLEDFTEVEGVDEGLGPAFNGTSCAGCHNIPAIGGSGIITEVRAGYRDESGPIQADPPEAGRDCNIQAGAFCRDCGQFQELQGGTLFHLFSIPNHRCQAQIPPEANVIARRISIPLFGAGLVEAIPDETLLALEDPDDRDNDGVRGRAARIIDVATGQRRVGRFGWKAQQATLLAFSADAYRNEMGITNDLFPDEVVLGVDPQQVKRCDPTADPEDVRDRRTGLRAIDKFEAFLRFLAPLERGPLNDSARRGEALFTALRCSACHLPELTTAASRNPVFDRRPVRLYSDLLLHDIGTGDGIAQADAGPEEIRTPALWGLRYRRPFLHDGSAATLDAAIRRHDREAAQIRERYANRSPEEQAAVLAFLKSL